MKTLGVPYTDQEVESAVADLEEQSKKIVSELEKQGVSDTEGLESKEIIALIAYLQRLGVDAKGGK